MGVVQQMVEGRRITDAETLKIVTMVYAGAINKNIVALLQSFGTDALGLTGADGNLIRAHKRIHPTIDYGFVGDVDGVDSGFLSTVLGLGKVPVLAPITSDGKGQLLNTNADTIAQETAKALSSSFEVSLVYSFEKPGVLLDVEDETSLVSALNPALYSRLKEEKKIFAGMIPKLDNAFSALNAGVKKVILGKAEEIDKLIQGNGGTTIHHEQ
jgi:acetylglutamate kinase